MTEEQQKTGRRRRKRMTPAQKAKRKEAVEKRDAAMIVLDRRLEENLAERGDHTPNRNKPKFTEEKSLLAVGYRLDSEGQISDRMYRWIIKDELGREVKQSAFGRLMRVEGISNESLAILLYVVNGRIKRWPDGRQDPPTSVVSVTDQYATDEQVEAAQEASRAIKEKREQKRQEREEYRRNSKRLRKQRSRIHKQQTRVFDEYEQNK